MPCPKCQSTQIVSVVFGYPTEETLEHAKRGEIELGGCAIPEEASDQHCQACILSTFALRAAAIHWNLTMPGFALLARDK